MCNNTKLHKYQSMMQSKTILESCLHQHLTERRSLSSCPQLTAKISTARLAWERSAPLIMLKNGCVGESMALGLRFVPC